MKKRFTEDQIVKILREAQTSGVVEACRKYRVSETTYYKWKKKFEGMDTSDVHKLKTLESENQRLKRLLADKELDIDALKALLEKYGSAR